MACKKCKSKNTRGGSWTMTRCLNCGAVEHDFTGEWYFDRSSRPTIKSIRLKSGYPLGKFANQKEK